MLRRVGGLGLALLVTLGVGVAHAEDSMTLRGLTSDGGDVELVIDSQWHLTHAEIEWKARCRHHGGKLLTGTAFDPLRPPSPGFYSSRGSYRFRIRGGYRVRVHSAMSGAEQLKPVEVNGQELWSGRFHAKAIVRRRGRVIAKCATKRLTWGAETNAAALPGTGTGTPVDDQRSR